MSGTWSRPQPWDLPQGAPCLVEGVVMDRRTTTRGEQYLLRLRHIAAPDGQETVCRNHEIYLYASPERVLHPGDVVVYRSVVRRLGSGKSYEGAMRHATYDAIRHTVDTTAGGRIRYRYEDSGLRVAGRAEGIEAWAWRKRREIAEALETSALSAEGCGLIRALVTGERAGVSPVQLDAFRDAGVAHTLAVSGMHVGILASAILLLTLPLNLISAWKWRYVAAAAVAWGFAVLTGMHYSALRAALMLTLSSAGMVTERRSEPFGGVCMAALIIIIISPGALWDVGFRLSFTCVAALSLFMLPLNPVSLRYHPTIYKITGTLLATIIATGATWVISAYYFGSVPLHFLASNVIFLPLMPLFMAGGIVYTILLVAGFDAEWLAWLLSRGTECVYDFMALFSTRTVQITPGWISVVLWLCGIAALGVSVHYYRQRPRTLPGAIVTPSAGGSHGVIPLHRPSLVLALLLMAASVGLMINL